MRYLVGLSAIYMMMCGAAAIAQQNQFPLAAPAGVDSKAREVAQKLRQVEGVSAAHAVTGPHDIIAMAEAADVSSLGELVVQKIQSVPGVNRSLTSIVAD